MGGNGALEWNWLPPLQRIIKNYISLPFYTLRYAYISVWTAHWFPQKITNYY